MRKYPLSIFGVYHWIFDIEIMAKYQENDG